MAEIKKLIPKRRFKEFQNAQAWEQRKLGEVSIYSNGGSYENYVKEDGKYELVTLKSIDMSGNLISSKKYIDIDVPTLKQGTLIMILSEQSPGLLGMTSIIPESSKFVLNQRVAEISPKDNVNNYFLSMLINRNQEYFSKRGAGTKVQNISKPNVENYEFYSPIFPEQTAIGNFFRTLDDTITLHKHKLEKTKALKSAYLSEMFPAEGERVPKRRFAGFTDEWEQRELGELADIIMGQSPDSINYTDNPNDHILVQGNADIKNGKVVPRVYTTQITKKANKGDLIFSVRAPVGDVGKTDYNVVLGRGVAAINGNEFIYQALVRMNKFGYWDKIIQGSTFESINSNDLKKALIFLPSCSEQAAIGNFFRTIDDLITIQQCKLDKLQNIKKAYLNEMFI